MGLACTSYANHLSTFYFLVAGDPAQLLPRVALHPGLPPLQPGGLLLEPTPLRDEARARVFPPFEFALLNKLI